MQEAEIRKIEVQSQPQANSSRNPTCKISNTKTGLVEWLKLQEHLPSKHKVDLQSKTLKTKHPMSFCNTRRCKIKSYK
jgi:hypothetical protein